MNKKKKPSKMTRAIRMARELKQARREIRFLQKERREQETLRKTQKETYDTWKENYTFECDKKIETIQKATAKEKEQLQKAVNEIQSIKLKFEKTQSMQVQSYDEIHDMTHSLVQKVEKLSPEALQAKHSQNSNDYARFIKNNPNILGNKNLQ